MPGRRARKPPT
ncbi:Phosphoheptose isomerase [Caballeronia sordidicola]|uniref:Phosphoheptose isomerase n=1 Tax=Caballeronia sordidicola TaxID=196367 RepID=A0A242MKD1_CABSO|nr:Phosphoheptose isomerase [Caballeronia sordidicola]